MSNKNSNYPTNQLNKLPAGTCADTISCLRDLADKGKPETEEELKQRIDDYFQFCVERDVRCGIESLCLSLSITRTTLFNWCNGRGCSREWQEICQNAKQFILTFLEQVSMSGKLNPATSIFLLKNVGGYKDSVSFEDMVPGQTPLRAMSPIEIARLYNTPTDVLTAADLPKLNNLHDVELPPT